jgi:GDP-L-fucose synthase
MPMKQKPDITGGPRTLSNNATARGSALAGISKKAAIYVAGHRGLVGSALLRCLERRGFSNLLTKSHQELDLTDQGAVADFFAASRPQYVLVSAARVGGILANNTYPAEFIQQNLAIAANLIHQAWLHGVKRLLFLGSSCIYPRQCPQPMQEDSLLTGPLEPTNRPYAVAKIAGIEMCWAYNRQYGTTFLSVMPTNSYGPGDNYDLETSHVLPALIRKMHQAKEQRQETVTLWGTGSPRREFIYSDDLAEACLFLLDLPEEPYRALCHQESAPLVNIGCGQDQTIGELASLVAEVVGFQGQIIWDSSKPDGTPRKLLDVSRLFSLGWRPRVGLLQGVARAYQDFLTRAG